MAQQFNAENFRNMIDALNTFAANASKTCTELRSVCASFAQLLGANNVAVLDLDMNAYAIGDKFFELAHLAKVIARDMDTEMCDHLTLTQILWDDI